MKINGSILLDDKGSFANVEPDEIKIKDFADMLLEADACKDKLYYDINSAEWMNFYAKSYTPCDEYWKECGQIAYQLLFMNSNPVFHPIVNNGEYNQSQEPKTYGGFRYDGCSRQNYVCDKSSIEIWHDNWLSLNPEKIDWKEFQHDIWPRFDKVIAILKEELYKRNIEIRQKNLDVVNDFYERIMKHLSVGERISYAIEIGTKICTANYYKREQELEKLEQAKGNRQAEHIFSIKKEETYIFLSIDKQHGMFELCGDKGNHINEIRFDGSYNSGSENDHGLKCVEEWKSMYKK